MKGFITGVVVLIILIGGYFYFDKLKGVDKDLKLNINTQTETQIIEKYLRENIKSVATNQPVLGGSWYVVSVKIDENLNRGTVVYEDGHIQSEADFEYDFGPADNQVIIKNFLQKI